MPRRTKKNPLPKAPAKRRFAGQPSVSPRQLSSSLARVRKFASDHERQERPFDPSRAPSWRGSSRDLVVNPRTRGPGMDAKLPKADDESVLRYVDIEGYKLLTWELPYAKAHRPGQYQTWIGYAFWDPQNTMLFNGEDLGVAPSQAIDSDDALRSLMGFLTLKPGDTDEDYFADYSPEQMAFAEGDAEMLSIYGMEPQSDDEDPPLAFRDLEWNGPPRRTKEDLDARASRRHRRNPPGDPRDVPHNLKGIEANRYRDVEMPTENGDVLRYEDIEIPRSADDCEWFIVGETEGGDYSGGSVAKSNYAKLEEILGEEYPDAEPAVWGALLGGHGSQAIIVKYGDLNDEVRGIVDALAEYPLIDEEHHSRLEYDEQNEAWERFIIKDYTTELGRLLGMEWPDELRDMMPDEQWYNVFDASREDANLYWEDGGEGQWIDYKRVAKKTHDLLSADKYPKHSNDLQDEAFDALKIVISKLPAQD